MRNRMLTVLDYEPVDYVGNLMGGYQAGQQIQQNRMKNKLLQQEMDERNAMKEALSGFGKDGYDMNQAVQKLMPINPEMALKVHDVIRKSSKEQLELLKAGAETTEKFAPGMIDNPQTYAQYHRMMTQLGIGGALPPVQSFVNPQTNQFDMNSYNSHIKNLVGLKDIIKEGLKPPEMQYQERHVGDKVVGGLFDKRTGKWTPTGTEAPRWNPETQGTRVYMDENGNPVVETGKLGPQPMTGLQKPTMNKIEEGLNSALQTRQALAVIEKQLNPNDLTYVGQIKNSITGIKAKINPKLVPPQDRDRLDKWVAHRATSKKLMSEELNRLSGAAISEHEMKRLEKYIPNAPEGWFDGDDPVTYQSKLRNFQYLTDMAIARLNYVRNRGFQLTGDPKEELPKFSTLDNMKKIIEDRYSELAREHKAQGLDDSTSLFRTRQKIAQEFGLVM